MSATSNHVGQVLPNTSATMERALSAMSSDCPSWPPYHGLIAAWCILRGGYRKIEGRGHRIL